MIAPPHYAFRASAIVQPHHSTGREHSLRVKGCEDL